MSDLLTVQDLEAAKKHDTFHSEVITGKAGGVASGASIDYATNSVTGQQQKTLPAVLRDIGYQQVGTFAAGYTLTNTMQTLLASTGRWYSWIGTFPHVVAAGTDPLSDAVNWIDRTEDQFRSDLKRNDGTKYIGGLDVIFFSNYNPPDDVVVTGDKFSGYTLVSGTDCTALFQQAVLDAQAAGKPLDLCSGNYLLSGATITAASGSCKIIGQSGYCNIYISGWENKTTTSDMSLTANTQFIFPMDGSVYGDDLKSNLIIQGIRFHNLDNTKVSKVFSAQYGMEQLEVSYCDAYDFTAFGRAGWNCVTNGTHAGSDAQSTIRHAVIYNNCVDSDDHTTGQCPKSFHIYQCSDTHTAANKLIGRGGGFVYRQNGGNYDTVPVNNRGSCNAKFIGNHVYTEHTGSEYNQYSKTTNIVIANNTFDATAGALPHNFMDLFNCISVTFTGNCGRGGGLLFMGHADLNNGSYPAKLIGSRGLVATGNVIVNPSHYSVFNLGGDGSVGSNRGFEDATISDNTVYLTPGYTLPRTCAFIYAFLAKHVHLSGNTIKDLDIYYKTYYCQDVYIDNELLYNVPSEIVSTGNDITSFRVGSMQRRGTTGTTTTFIGSSLLTTLEYISKIVAKSGITSESAVTAPIFYTDSKSSGYVSNGSVSFSLTKDNDKGLFKLYTALVTSAGSATYGEFLIRTSGTVGTYTSVVADENIVITLTVTSTTVTCVVSHAAGTKTLYASIMRVL